MSGEGDKSRVPGEEEPAPADVDAEPTFGTPVTEYSRAPLVVADTLSLRDPEGLDTTVAELTRNPLAVKMLATRVQGLASEAAEAQESVAAVGAECAGLRESSARLQEQLAAERAAREQERKTARDFLEQERQVGRGRELLTAVGFGAFFCGVGLINSAPFVGIPMMSVGAIVSVAAQTLLRRKRSGEGSA